MPARHRPQAWILIEISWGLHASLADYLSFASRRSIDEPQDLADRPNPRSRYSTAALPDCTEKLPLCAHDLSGLARKSSSSGIAGWVGRTGRFIFVCQINRTHWSWTCSHFFLAGAAICVAHRMVGTRRDAQSPLINWTTSRVVRIPVDTRDEIAGAFQEVC